MRFPREKKDENHDFIYTFIFFLFRQKKEKKFIDRQFEKNI